MDTKKMLKIAAIALVSIILSVAVYMLIKHCVLNEPLEVVSMNSEQINMGSNIGMGSTTMEPGLVEEPQMREDPLTVNSYEEDRPFSGATLTEQYNSMERGQGDIVPMDLLPNNDAAAVFAAENPNANIQSVNYLTAGFNNGIDSRGGTMKNASRDIRGDIHIPKVYVGPWNQSTYEPDPYANALCN